MNNRVFSNGLTPAEDERLSLLLEEMGEAIQIIGKIMRHGYNSCNPNDPSIGTNRELLAHELGHVDYVFVLMVNAGDISENLVDQSREAKASAIRPYLHHNESATK